MSLVLALLGALRAAFRTRTDLTLENLALRQQLALLRRRSERPQFGRLGRLLGRRLDAERLRDTPGDRRMANDSGSTTPRAVLDAQDAR